MRKMIFQAVVLAAVSALASPVLAAEAPEPAPVVAQAGSLPPAGAGFATKADIRWLWEQSERRWVELRAEISAMRGEMSAMQSGLRGEIGGIRAEMSGMRSEQSAFKDTVILLLGGILAALLGIVGLLVTLLAPRILPHKGNSAGVGRPASGFGS